MNRTGITLAVPLALIYIVLWVGYVQGWVWLHELDWSLLNPAHDIGTKNPTWVRFWDCVSFALGPIPLRLLSVAAMVIALVQRKVRMALLLLFCGPLNGLVTWAAKSLADRPRPMTALVSAPSSSFPSGHAFAAMTSLLALLTLLLSMMRSRVIQIVAIAVSALSVLLVGISRVALNVHHPLMCLLVGRWGASTSWFFCRYSGCPRHERSVKRMPHCAFGLSRRSYSTEL